MRRFLTLKQKITFCEGKNLWQTKALPGIGIRSLFMSDGPHGLRKQDKKKDTLATNRSRPATCFPAAVSMACSWDTELIGSMGKAIAEEAVDQAVDVVLGPGINIKRNPLCGRSFEYFSEDPYLAGQLGASWIRSVQQLGISASLKHFACNNQELNRMRSNSILDERTLRELYLTAFEIAVKAGKPQTVMCAYNQINGVYCSDSRKLLTQILRQEWGFDGVVITDWGAMHDRILAFKAGCDLNMPGGSHYMVSAVRKAVKSGSLDERFIDQSVQRIQRLAHSIQESNPRQTACSYKAHHNLARIAAEQSAVLLKNDHLLPLRQDQTVAMVGDMVENMRYQGSGSSQVNPVQVVHPSGVMTVGADCEQADVVIVCTGLPSAEESEGFDRDSMALPESAVACIEAAAAKNPNVVVVLFCGAPVEMPWIDRVKAILYMGLPGQAGGAAMKNLIFGNANPAGKLAESWPDQYRDCPSAPYYQKDNAQYREGLYVGYRYYDKAQIKIRFPFGFGLSYTTFAYDSASIAHDQVFVTVTNSGDRSGSEIVMLFVAPPQDGLYRPLKELKRFTKIHLRPGEQQTVSFHLDDRCYAIWHQRWQVPPGDNIILVGGQPEHLLVAGTVSRKGQVIQKPVWQPKSWYETLSGYPTQKTWESMIGDLVISDQSDTGRLTLNHTLGELKRRSVVIRFLYRIAVSIVAGKSEPGTAHCRMLLSSIENSPLRALHINSGQPVFWFKVLLVIANGVFRKR